MASKKLRVGVLFGGRSGEHEVSLRSARSILQAIDRRKYEVVELGITREGRWLSGRAALAMLASDATKDQTTGIATEQTTEISIPAAAAEPQVGAGLDVVFPVLHGTFGEDGAVQGLFELANLAYVGSGVLGSAAAMDKDAMKRLFAAARLPITPHVTILRKQWRSDPRRATRSIEKTLRYPLFVKPANLGSSVGISKVKTRAELCAAMELAAGFDRKIVIEQGVGGPGIKPRELELAVLGNDDPQVSVVGEIVPAKEFYDYQAKYELSGPDESACIIPARLTAAQVRKIQAMALAAFKACDCAGLARVDFLMAPAGKGKPAEILLNEVNTLPGFTSISMYPKLWLASGLSYPELIDRLIELAMERHKERIETRFSL
ncbi:MAG: D-alanine--D-alanine ligase family protein [Acidobacteriaceae bacterium]